MKIMDKLRNKQRYRRYAVSAFTGADRLYDHAGVAAVKLVAALLASTFGLTAALHHDRFAFYAALLVYALFFTIEYGLFLTRSAAGKVFYNFRIRLELLTGTGVGLLLFLFAIFTVPAAGSDECGLGEWILLILAFIPVAILALETSLEAWRFLWKTREEQDDVRLSHFGDI